MTSQLQNFTWRARYATHIPSIDAYHQGLFKVLRKLLQASRKGRMGTELGPILEFLENYTRAHLDGEEAFMRRTGFPEAAAHLDDHHRFMAQLSRLRDRFKQGDQGIEGELILVLSGWLSEHLLEKDRIFADYVHGRSKA